MVALTMIGSCNTVDYVSKLNKEAKEQRRMLQALQETAPVKYFRKNVLGNLTKTEAFYVIGKDTSYIEIDEVEIGKEKPFIIR